MPLYKFGEINCIHRSSYTVGVGKKESVQ